MRPLDISRIAVFAAFAIALGSGLTTRLRAAVNPQKSAACPAISSPLESDLLIGVNTITGERRCQCLKPKIDPSTGIPFTPSPPSTATSSEFRIVAGHSLRAWKEANEVGRSVNAGYEKAFSFSSSAAESYENFGSVYEESGEVRAALWETSGSRFNVGQIELNSAGQKALKDGTWLSICGNAFVSELVHGATRTAQIHSKSLASYESIEKIYHTSTSATLDTLFTADIDTTQIGETAKLLKGYTITQDVRDDGIPTGVSLTVIESLTDTLTAAQSFRKEMAGHPIDTETAPTNLRVTNYSDVPGIEIPDVSNADIELEQETARFYDAAIERIAGLKFIIRHRYLFSYPPVDAMNRDLDHLKGLTDTDHPQLFVRLDKCLAIPPNSAECKALKQMIGEKIFPVPPPARVVPIVIHDAVQFPDPEIFVVGSDPIPRAGANGNVYRGISLEVPCGEGLRWYVDLKGESRIFEAGAVKRVADLRAGSPELALYVSSVRGPTAPIMAPTVLTEVPEGSVVHIGTPEVQFRYPPAQCQGDCLQVTMFSPVVAEQVKSAWHPAWPGSTCPTSADVVYGIRWSGIPPGFKPVDKKDVPEGVSRVPIIKSKDTGKTETDNKTADHPP